MKLHGYIITDQNFWPLNLMLMITRKYIFWCAKKDYKLNIFFLQKEIKKYTWNKKTLSLINSQSDQLKKKWNFWKHIFDIIDM